MSRENINYNEKQAVSEIFKLTNVVTDESIALIPCDSAGNFTIAGVSRAPIQKNAIQTTSQGGEWSDLEYPFMAIQQEDWTGGRANYRFSGDTSRFFDSKRAQTAFNECIFNAPLDYYSTGFKKAYTNHPDSIQFIRLRGDTQHIIQKISVTDFACGNVYIHLRRRGTPRNGLTVRLLNNMSSHPVIYASHTYTTEEVTDITTEFYKFSFPEINFSGDFYLEVFTKDTDEQNYWEVGCANHDDMETYKSPSGSGWEIFKMDLIYRLDTAQKDIRTRFFTYNQLLFMVKQDPQNNPSLWLNGDIGKATSAKGTTITDVKKNWEIDCWENAKIGLIYRNGAEGHISVWRTITENTANTITVDEPWDIRPDANTIYIICDTPLWHEISDHGLTAYITDVHVIRDVVYFAQGDYVNMRKMRYNRSTGEFEWLELPDTYATYLYSVRDKAGLMLWRGRNDDDMHERSVERSDLLDWETPDEKDEEEESEDTDEEETEDEPKIRTDKLIISKLEKYDETEKTTDPNSSPNGNYPYFDSETGELIVPGTTPPDGTTEETSEEEVGTDKPALTEVYDNEIPDYDKKRYKIVLEKFESKSLSGKATFQLQESNDNETWFNVSSIAIDSAGTWYMTAHCKYRYRRFKITLTGTEAKLSGIKIYTTQLPDFTDKQILLDNYGKITKLFEYGAESVKSLWVFQEGMVSSVNKTDDNYTLDRFNLDEMRTTADEWNGSATSSNHVYLLWSWLNGLQRHYGTELEGKGPDHDEGMPDDMKGRVTQILAYPGSFFISIDAGKDGYSSIMMFNGSGWHNLYKAPNKGERIFDIEYQPIYGDRPDRLWAQVGDNIIWLAMPSKILYALHDKHAEYTHESVVVSSWITGGMAEVEKLWQSLSIMADNLDGKNCWIEADYQLDDEKTWHPIPTNPYRISPQQEENFGGENESVNGKKIRYRLRLQTTDKMKSPKVNVILIKAVGRIDIKYSYGFHFRNIKYKENLSSDYQEIEPYVLQAILDDWANRLCTLRMNSAYRIYDDKKVFVDATTTSILTEKREGYLSQITLTEI